MSELNPSRYCIGIDLGTTNCVVAYVDTEAEGGSGRVQIMNVPQWVDLEVAESLNHLPSFHYALTRSQLDVVSPLMDQVEPVLSGSADVRVGEFARRAGLSSPGRQIASAKSWLSHEGVDRSADLLPWHADSDVDRKSPQSASAAYLSHLRLAWDAQFPDYPMAEQDIVITLPASFDEVARELTVGAAAQAGLPRIQLIEEPQAAFYAWIDRQGDEWQSKVRAGQMILVCDIGGGTTDLTLIRVRDAIKQNDDGDSESIVSEATNSDALQFHRVAVGKHLILGGDNLDLAVAKLGESKLGSQLSGDQWQRLVAAARDVKDTMLGDDPPEQMTLMLPGTGASLIGGSVAVEVTAGDIEETLLDGFFPRVGLEDHAETGQSGFQEIGLPYAADAAVTRHLAEFLSQHRTTGMREESNDSDEVDLVLFNGGVMRSPAVRQRLVDCLSDWFPGDTGKVDALGAPRLDLAVAEGAAYYALVRRGQGVRIAANLARSYFVQISQSPAKAVCVIPAEAQGGQSFRIDSLPMSLRVGQPVTFPIWVSSTRLADQPGDVIDINPSEMTPLPPIHTALRERKKRDVRSVSIVLEAELSEIGTIGLYCVTEAKDVGKTGKRWKLEFDIRATLHTDLNAYEGGGEAIGVLDNESIETCQSLIEDVFVQKSRKPSELIKRMQYELEMKRDEWPPVLLREVWQRLMNVESGRRHSAHHEARWLNTLGFALRPGYGVAVDDWRVGETWRKLHGKVAHADAQVRAESYVLWRRIAGGMTEGYQQQLASGLRKLLMGGGSSIESSETAEAWRLVGALERLNVAEKVDWLDAACTQMQRRNAAPLLPILLWVVGRVGARVPMDGPLNLVVPVEAAEKTIVSVLSTKGLPNASGQTKAAASLALTQLAHQCNDRFRDVSAKVRGKVAEALERMDSPDHYVRLVLEGGEFDRDEQAALLGDTLPLGIELR